MGKVIGAKLRHWAIGTRHCSDTSAFVIDDVMAIMNNYCILYNTQYMNTEYN